jgi:hypothetical protein
MGPAVEAAVAAAWPPAGQFDHEDSVTHAHPVAVGV